MTSLEKRLYKGRAALNVLASSVENAKEVFEAAEGYVLIGILSKNYASVDEAVAAMQAYGQAIDNAVSIGLGGGDSRQASMVAEIARRYPGSHINQVLPYVGRTSAALGRRDVWMNSLVSPSGQVGLVDISTGPISGAHPQHAIVPVRSAIALVQDMGGHALKFYPMGGLGCEPEYRAVAEACGQMQFALEPTGGIDPDNFSSILQIALDANVPQVIPHVYTSIIDKHTGHTNPALVRQLVREMKEAVDRHES